MLPWPTRALLAVSGFLQAFGPWLLVAPIAGVWMLRLAVSRPGPKAVWDRILLRLPLIGRLVRGIVLAVLLPIIEINQLVR